MKLLFKSQKRKESRSEAGTVEVELDVVVATARSNFHCPSAMTAWYTCPNEYAAAVSRALSKTLSPRSPRSKIVRWWTRLSGLRS